MAVEKQTAQIILEVDEKSAKDAEQRVKKFASTRLQLAVNVAELQQQMGILK